MNKSMHDRDHALLKHHKTKLIGLTNNPVIKVLFSGKVMHILTLYINGKTYIPVEIIS